MNHHFEGESIPNVFREIGSSILRHGEWVHTEKWQGVPVGEAPDMRTLELLNVTVSVPMGERASSTVAAETGASMPWAYNHFLERVCGYPINPGTEWAKWPWGGNAAKFLEAGIFNHNYMERYWPKFAGTMVPPSLKSQDFQEFLDEQELIGGVYPNFGIRNHYGDLGDLVKLLAEEPLTRQAYLPIFFPEDTGKGDGGRKPCTLGYQFIVRRGQLHCWYPLRSCDFIRHFRDDFYLTYLLMVWVREKCFDLNPAWGGINLGNLSMHMTSLHVFTNDVRAMDARYG